jgi:hypothetical protein
MSQAEKQDPEKGNIIGMFSTAPCFAIVNRLTNIQVVDE